MKSCVTDKLSSFLPVAQDLTLSACGVKPSVNRSYTPVGAVFLVFASLAVSMRFANSFYTTGRYGWDDRFLALALVICLVLAL